MQPEAILPVPASFPAASEAPFQLEASRDGIRLRLEQAMLGSRVQVRDLRMAARKPPGSMDLAAGPRSLRSTWASMEGLELWLRLEGLQWTGSRGVRIQSVHPIEGGRRLWICGRIDDVPFTVRARIVALDTSDADLELRFEEPRVFGWIGLSWGSLGPLALEGVRLPWARVVADSGVARAWVLSPLLQGLLAERGWKVPDRRGVRLLESRQEGPFWVVRFGREEPVAGTPKGADHSPPGGEDDRLEEELRECFRENRQPEEGLLVQGLRHPRLWPEVLGRCREVGEERPEWIRVSLTALLLADRLPDLVSQEDRFRWIRRLVINLQREEGLRDLRWGAGWIAEATRALLPNIAWSLLEEMLSLGVAEPDLFRVASVCLERLGRTREAEALRSRMLALAPPDEVEGLVERALASLDEAGLCQVADDWLDRLLERPEESGPPDVFLRRSLRKLQALRRMAREPEGSLELWRAMLEENPLDPEVQDLLRVVIREDAQAYEAASRLAEMARERPERRNLLRYAASLLETRPGLRGKAARWYEESLEGDPHPEPVLEALDRLYRLLGRRPERRSLLERRVALDPESPRAAEWRLELAREAMAEGDDPAAARSLREVLRREPTHRSALLLARQVHQRTGDHASLMEIEEALRDLGEADLGSPASLADSEDRWIRVLEEQGRAEEVLPELVRLAAQVVERPGEAIRMSESLDRAVPRIRLRWGPLVAADLEELAAWIRETLHRGPSKSDLEGPISHSGT